MPLIPLKTAEAYWELAPETLFSRLQTTPDGLSDAEARLRLAQIGPNSVRTTSLPATAQLLFGQFRSPLVLILLFAIGVSALAGEWLDALIILTIVLGSVLLAFFQEYSAGHAIAKLRA